MPDCPAPDCDYSNPSEEAVKGHWGGSQDAQHAGKWHKAMEAYEEARGATAVEAQGEATPARASQGPSDANSTPSDPSDGPQRLELPTRDSDTAESPSEPADDGVACPECGSDRASTVGEETETLREQGFDPTAVPQDAYVCYDCWTGGTVSVYK